MAVLHVAQLGHPVLRRAAERVEPDSISSAAFQSFCDDLLQTLEYYNGAGLAAPQVHVSRQVVVLTMDTEKGPEFLINPKIDFIGDKRLRTWEGCLSVEGMRGAVDRPAHIRVRALSRYGDPVAYELLGYPAVVAQHECDHLRGVLYVDRFVPGTLVFLSEFQKHGPPEGWDTFGETDAGRVAATTVP